MKTNIHFWSYLAQFFLEWVMFQTKVVEKIKHILCLIFFFLENHTVYGIKCKTTLEWDRWQVTVWSIRIVCYVPKATNTHVRARTYALRIGNTSRFSTATMVLRTLSALFFPRKSRAPFYIRSQICEKRLFSYLSVCNSVRTEQLVFTIRIFIEFYIWVFPKSFRQNSGLIEIRQE